MEQIERPDVESSSSQIHASGSFGFYSHSGAACRLLAAASATCHAIADQQRRVPFFLGLRGVRLKTPTATRFVQARGPDPDQLFAFDQTLRVSPWVSATHANRQ